MHNTEQEGKNGHTGVSSFLGYENVPLKMKYEKLPDTFCQAQT
jgi:hypothetical protein